MKHTPKNFYGAPLSVEVKKGKLTIGIGIETLAHALKYAEWAQTEAICQNPSCRHPVHLHEAGYDNRACFDCDCRDIQWKTDDHGDYAPRFTVTDEQQFAEDVMHAMLHEREDGSSPLTDFLDKMMEAALDDGSTGVNYDDD